MMDYAEKILEKTNDGLNVFNYYMPIPFKPKKKFLNPFYKDTKPGCYIYRAEQSPKQTVNLL